MLISQTQLISSNWTTSFFGLDGHGSVRFLMDSSGNATDAYDYDAFGILIHQTGSTQNVYLYSSEQFDPDLGLYYQRARYLNSFDGRFLTQDPSIGERGDPSSLHRYLYASSNPVDRRDPSGKSFIDQVNALAVQAILYVQSIPGQLLAAFAGGGTAVGVLFNSLGVVSEQFAEETLTLVETELPEIEVASQQEIGDRVLDFVIKSAENTKQLFLEAKYGIPYKVGDAMTRLVGQVQAAIGAAEETGGQAILWTLKQPGQYQLNLLSRQLGDKIDKVKIVSGVEALATFVLDYFKGK